MKKVKIPAGFEELARQYGMDSECLAQRVLARFVKCPPAKITVRRLSASRPGEPLRQGRI